MHAPVALEGLTAADVTAGFDVERIRTDFPILATEVHGQPLVYLDNAATAQKPLHVLDRIRRYYEQENANVHRGVHFLSQKATDEYEAARATIARFINAPAPEQVIYTRGTTESVNLVAATYGRANVGPGDEVIVSTLEHHSNIVPWQMLCEEKGATLRVIPMTDAGELALDAYRRLLSPRTRIVSVCHVSNALGTVNPVREMIAGAHAAGAVVVLDGAQAAPHLRIDVQALDADFYCFSGHKLFGPTGIGVLYGRRELLDAMPPWQGGGDMIERVSFERTTYNTVPHKFEAGTPHVEGAVGLAAAVEYVESVGLEAIGAYEQRLLAYASARALEIEGLQIVGTAQNKASVLSFLIDGIHPYDAGTILDRLGIAIRTGHHCTQPLMSRLGIPGTARASFAFYNTPAEVDALIEGLHKVKALFP